MSRINGITLSVVAVGLAVYQPLGLAGDLPDVINALPIRGLGLAAGMVGRVLVAALCAAAGLALFNRRPIAPPLARAAVVLSGAADLMRYSTHIFPSNRPPGSAPIFVATSVALHGATLTYLLLSKAVRDLS